MNPTAEWRAKDICRRCEYDNNWAGAEFMIENAIREAEDEARSAGAKEEREAIKKVMQFDIDCSCCCNSSNAIISRSEGKHPVK